MRSVLVLGGARSGKTRYALALAEAASPQRAMIATAQAFDEEMAERIARHKAERGEGWTTHEAPLALAEVLREAAGPGRAVVVDCLTLWLSNLLLAGQDIEAATADLAALVPCLEGPAIFVSNEVGQGIVPETPLGRKFRDVQGRANQALAAACDAVVLVTAGLPRQVKPTRPGARVSPWLKRWRIGAGRALLRRCCPCSTAARRRKLRSPTTAKSFASRSAACRPRAATRCGCAQPRAMFC